MLVSVAVASYSTNCKQPPVKKNWVILTGRNVLEYDANRFEATGQLRATSVKARAQSCHLTCVIHED